MEQITILILLALSMFVGSFIAGALPACFNWRSGGVSWVSIYGAGLILGVSMLIIIPEGISSIYITQFWKFKQLLQDTPSSIVTFELLENPSGSSIETHVWIGIYLIVGFVLMVVAEQVLHIWREASMDPRPNEIELCSDLILLQNCDYFRHEDHSETEKKGFVDLNDSTKITIIGMAIHCIADGFAFGAASYVKNISFGLLIFLALMLHKAPAMFGVATFLLSSNCATNTLFRIMACITAISPGVALLTYLAIGFATGSSPQSHGDYQIVAICLLISAGSFLYIATLHVLPEIYCNEESHRPHTHTHIHSSQAHSKEQYSKLFELIIMIGGFMTPLLLTLFVPHED